MFLKVLCKNISATFFNLKRASGLCTRPSILLWNAFVGCENSIRKKIKSNRPKKDIFWWKSYQMSSGTCQMMYMVNSRQSGITAVNRYVLNLSSSCLDKLSETLFNLTACVLLVAFFNWSQRFKKYPDMMFERWSCNPVSKSPKMQQIQTLWVLISSQLYTRSIVNPDQGDSFETADFNFGNTVLDTIFLKLRWNDFRFRSIVIILSYSQVIHWGYWKSYVFLPKPNWNWQQQKYQNQYMCRDSHFHRYVLSSPWNKIFNSQNQEESNAVMLQNIFRKTL